MTFFFASAAFLFEELICKETTVCWRLTEISCDDGKVIYNVEDNSKLQRLTSQ